MEKKEEVKAFRRESRPLFKEVTTASGHLLRARIKINILIRDYE